MVTYYPGLKISMTILGQFTNSTLRARWCALRIPQDRLAYIILTFQDVKYADAIKS